MHACYAPEAVNIVPRIVGPATRQKFIVVYFCRMFQRLVTRTDKTALRLISSVRKIVFIIAATVFTTHGFNQRGYNTKYETDERKGRSASIQKATRENKLMVNVQHLRLSIDQKAQYLFSAICHRNF